MVVVVSGLYGDEYFLRRNIVSCIATVLLEGGLVIVCMDAAKSEMRLHTLAKSCCKLF